MFQIFNQSTDWALTNWIYAELFLIEVFEIGRRQFYCMQINEANYQTYNQIIYEAKKTYENLFILLVENAKVGPTNM